MAEFRSCRGILIGLAMIAGAGVLPVGANAAPAVQTTTTEQTTTTTAPSRQVITTTTTERTEQPVVRHPAHKTRLARHPVRHDDILVKETTTGESVTIAPVPIVKRTTTTETTNVQ